MECMRGIWRGGNVYFGTLPWCKCGSCQSAWRGAANDQSCMKAQCGWPVMRDGFLHEALRKDYLRVCTCTCMSGCMTVQVEVHSIGQKCV